MAAQAPLISTSASTMSEPTVTVPFFPSTSVVAMNISSSATAKISTTLSTFVTSSKSAIIAITSSLLSPAATEPTADVNEEKEKLDLHTFAIFMTTVGIAIFAGVCIIICNCWNNRRRKLGKPHLWYKLPKSLRPLRYKKPPPIPPIALDYTGRRKHRSASSDIDTKLGEDILPGETGDWKWGRRGRKTRSSFGQSFPPGNNTGKDIGVHHWEPEVFTDPTEPSGGYYTWRPTEYPGLGSALAVAMAGLEEHSGNVDNGEGPSGSNSVPPPDNRPEAAETVNNTTPAAVEITNSPTDSDATAAGSNAVASNPSSERGSSDSEATEADPDEAGGVGSCEPEARDQLVTRNDYCQNQ